MTTFISRSAGKSLEFSWQGTQLGIRVEGEANFTYVDLQGEPGEQGVPGISGSDGASLEFSWQGTQLGVRVEGEANFTYTDLKGEPGTTDYNLLENKPEVIEVYPYLLDDPTNHPQGSYWAWNTGSSAAGFNGETDFVNHKGLGVGGFAFFNKKNDNVSPPTFIGSLNDTSLNLPQATAATSTSTGAIRVGNQIGLGGGNGYFNGNLYIQGDKRVASEEFASNAEHIINGKLSYEVMPDEVLLNFGDQNIYGSNSLFGEEIFKGLQGNKIRFISQDENHGVFFRIDNGNFYLMLTADGNAYGTWNSFRPFYVSLNNGNVGSNKIYTNTNPENATNTTTGGVRLSGIGLGGGNGYFSGNLYINSNQQVPSFESGTFIPYFRTQNSSTQPGMSFQWGNYSKIGNICFITLQINTSSSLTDNSQLRIYGLPSPSASGVRPIKLQPLTQSALILPIDKEIAPTISQGGGSYIIIHTIDRASGSVGNMLGTDLKSGTMQITGFYFV